MTVAMTLLSVPVFVITCFTQGLKTAFKRMVSFIAAGLIFDVSMIVLVTMVLTLA